MNKCLVCYESLLTGETHYHEGCYKKSFMAQCEPVVPYRLEDISLLAEQVILSRFSVTGVQPKISLGVEKSQGIGKLTIIGYKGNYILKPQSPRWPELPENEQCTMKCAELLGIPVVPYMLIPMLSGDLAYITKRIDRQGESKIHMEDMAQVSGRLTEHKYHGSVQSVGKLVFRYSENKMFDVGTFFELVLFAFLTGNSDMHLKNYSLVYQGNSMGLSPAYDLLNTRIITDDNEESALTINGKKNRITLSDFDAAGKTMGIPPRAREKTYEKFSSLLPRMIGSIRDSFLSENMKQKYLENVDSASSALKL